jgi:membrane-associated protease RseP (regulator of RpoE activity)
MSSKLKKWYVILGLTLGGLAVCSLLLMAGGLAGGVAGYVAAHRGGDMDLPGPLGEERHQDPRDQGIPELSPPAPQPRQMPPEMMLAPFSGDLWGATVVEVDPDAPADRAGIQEADIILAVNNKALDEDRDLAALIGGHNPGDEVVVTIVRPGDDPVLMNLEVTLDSHTNEEGEEVARLGLRYKVVSSGAGLMPLGQDWGPGGDAPTY